MKRSFSVARRRLRQVRGDRRVAPDRRDGLAQPPAGPHVAAQGGRRPPLDARLVAEDAQRDPGRAPGLGGHQRPRGGDPSPGCRRGAPGRRSWSGAAAPADPRSRRPRRDRCRRRRSGRGRRARSRGVRHQGVQALPPQFRQALPIPPLACLQLRAGSADARCARRRPTPAPSIRPTTQSGTLNPTLLVPTRGQYRHDARFRQAVPAASRSRADCRSPGPGIPRGSTRAGTSSCRRRIPPPRRSPPATRPPASRTRSRPASSRLPISTASSS